MSFSTDLDAARERAGLPVVQRLKCLEDGDTLITINRGRAGAFQDAHLWCAAGYRHLTKHEGPGRFRIKRAVDEHTPWLWIVRDAERPRAFGWARTHAAAIELVGAMHARPGQHVQVLDDDDEVVAYVPGIMPLERYDRHVNAPCTVEPVLPELDDDDDGDWRRF